MTHEQHRLRHELLHEHLDELIADWLAQTDALPSTSTVMDLMQWSHAQTKNPTHNRFVRHAAHLPVIEVDRG